MRRTHEERTLGTAAPLWSLRSSRPGAGDEACGTFETGRRFLDWLSRTGQTAWQLLPLSRTHLEPGSKRIRVPSPYKGYGVGFDPRHLSPALRDVMPLPEERRRFLKEQRWWIDDYALFEALTDRFGTDDWTAWPAAFRDRSPSALARFRKEGAEAIERAVVGQWRLSLDFDRLKAEARRRGIALLGDLSFYLPLRSPLVWANRACFDIGADGTLRRVSGVPDGPRAHYGRQIWGHPLYRWSHRGAWRAIAALWRRRVAYHAFLYDHMRLDHAKGFYAYGAMDVRDRSKDRILPGPGTAQLDAVIAEARARGLGLYAEDAGDRLEELRRDLRSRRVSGIRIFRYAYNEKKKIIEHDYAEPRHYPKNAFAYTTTHDTVTLMGYVRLLTMAETKKLCGHLVAALKTDARAQAATFRRLVLRSPAGTVILPIQDWLLSVDRINVPGTEKAVGDPNWRYRVPSPIEALPRTLPGRGADQPR